MRITAILFIIIVSITGCNQAENDDKKLHDTMDLNSTLWTHQTNVYEVNLRQYSSEGTINAFAKHLPRLRAMGVETLWFMPLTPIAQKNKKGSLGSYYACSDYTSVSPEFGTLNDFKSLVKQAHEMGFKVIIDWVANHTGWDHKWTIEHPDYYEHDSSTNNFKVASGMDDIIELNFKNPALRKAMIDAMKFWITETDIDGFRCDLAFWVELDFWKEAKTEVEKIKKLFWLGELDPLDNPDYFQVFDAAYSWSWMHRTQEFYEKKASFEQLDTLLNRYDSVAGKDKMLLWFTTNHDENSWNGTEYEKYGKLAPALAVFSFTWNGIPLIYSGQELPNMKRLKFFEKDSIEWNGKYALEDFYSSLLRLRKTNVALSAGDPSSSTYRLRTGHDGKVLGYVRKNGKKEVLVLLNFTDEPLQCIVDNEPLKGVFRNVFNAAETRDVSLSKTFILKPWGYEVWEK